MLRKIFSGFFFCLGAASFANIFRAENQMQMMFCIMLVLFSILAYVMVEIVNEISQPSNRQ